MTAGATNEFSGVIPPNHDMEQVDFYVEATDNYSLSATNPTNAPVEFHYVPISIASIYDINYVDQNSEDQGSEMVGKLVRVTGIITAGTTDISSPTQFLLQEREIQDSSGMNPGIRMHAGIFVHEEVALDHWYRGDLLELVGIVSEDEGNTTISPRNASAINFIDFGQSIPAVQVANAILNDDTLEDGDGILGEAYEGVWVKTNNCFVSNLNLPFEESFVLKDGDAVADTLIVHPYVELAYTPQAEDPITVEGFMIYRDSDFRLAPIDDSFAWDGTGANGQKVPSGTYFARLRLGSEVLQVRKIMMVK